jgi:predicted CXXCH cytochrome family protein
MIESLSGSEVPQVYHNDGTGDLAAGNFIYILGGGKGGAGSDNKGHNVVDFGNNESTLSDPPGHGHSGLIPSIGINITCSGIYGCHGLRTSGGGITGAHHNNVDGQLSTANEIYNSYRFLKGVKGFEYMGTYKWQNKDASNHNEYFGDTSPMVYGGGTCTICHAAIGLEPDNNTISGFCNTCHRDFHILAGIGNDTNSPFTRHPTDVILPGAGTEYAGYTSYNISAPVARTSVPAVPSSTVAAGDVVMCLSCHMAHASNNDDMLRWDYRNTTLATAITGCAVCHTSKD